MKEKQNTLKENFSMKLVGFSDQSIIDQLSFIFKQIVINLATEVDVKILQGITFTLNSECYLREIKSFNKNNSASNDEGIGIAKTISKIDGDFRKNYIVINCEYLELEYLLNQDNYSRLDEKACAVLGQLMHIIFHEYCHVQNNMFLVENYPEFFGKILFSNDLEMMKHHISYTTWDEFIVCSMANQIGTDQGETYESLLLDVMNNFEKKKNLIYKRYLNEKVNKDTNSYLELFLDTYVLIFSLFKYSGYYLGDIYTKEDNRISEKILNHDLAEVILNLQSKLGKMYSKKLDHTLITEDFYEIGKYAEEFARVNGLEANVSEKNDLFVNLSITTQARLLHGVYI